MNSLKKYKELVVFDTETTGLSHTKNRIIELAVCRFVLIDNDFVLKDEMDVLIKIDENLPLEITNLTGITDQMLKEKGIEEVEAIKLFLTRFVSVNNDKKLFMAYNAPFDINFIEAMLNRHGESFFGKGDFLDILTVYKDRADYPHRLKDALEHYQLTDKFVNSHRAVDDCIACYQALVAMGKENDNLDKYINLFGYNPKYPATQRVPGVTYLPQPYGVKLIA